MERALARRSFASTAIDVNADDETKDDHPSNIILQSADFTDGLYSLSSDKTIPPPPSPLPVLHAPSKRAIGRSFPFFTVFIVLNTSVIFIMGAYLMDWKVPIGWGVYGETVPNSELLPFQVITSFSEGCKDLRRQGWRLITYQLVHAGFFHFIMNQICVVCYGLMLEGNLQTSSERRFLGSIQVFCAFEYAVIFGALGNAYDYGYTVLVGNSGGCYGLVGLGWGVLLTGGFSKERKHNRLLFIILTVQMLFDILSFTVLYSPNFGYLCHFSGWLAGLSTGLIFGLFTKSTYRYLYFFFGSAIFIFMTAFLSYHYANDFPPQFHVNPTFDEEYHRASCCLSAYRLIGADAATYPSISHVQEQFYCKADILVDRYT